MPKVFFDNTKYHTVSTVAWAEIYLMWSISQWIWFLCCLGWFTLQKCHISTFWILELLEKGGLYVLLATSSNFKNRVASTLGYSQGPAHDRPHDRPHDQAQYRPHYQSKELSTFTDHMTNPLTKLWFGDEVFTSVLAIEGALEEERRRRGGQMVSCSSCHNSSTPFHRNLQISRHKKIQQLLVLKRNLQTEDLSIIIIRC